MTTALIYLLVMLLVAAVVFLLSALVFGRGEELAPLAPGGSPTRLPAGDLAGDDVTAVKFQLTARGYKMSEVDWVIARLGGEIDGLRARIAELETELDARSARTGQAAGVGPGVGQSAGAEQSTGAEQAIGAEQATGAEPRTDRGSQ
ncbi:hypothetical protein GCM10009676_35440 [Prauserella halophila]|uniref:DivIVA domain-containing protein n=1 Tax=Prauserella halophila TaxID=185641 RepID=A0ABN1WDQ4_9PSEU|nr:DivIVA domain-containing protein [Prauserella halophila]